MIVVDFGEVDALVVHAPLNGERGGLGLGLGEMMVAEDVDDRVAVGDDVALKLPFVSQLVLQQELIYARRLSVDAVISAHHRSGLGFGHGCAKCRQICVQLIMFADHHIRVVARAFWPAVDRVMFRRRNDAIVFRIVALHARNERHSHSGRQERVFPVGFLSASPAGIAKDVDVRRPEVETLKDVAVAVLHSLHVLDSRLNAGRNRHPVNGIRIERRGQADRLRERGDTAVVRYAMQRLAPPVVVRHIQPRNRARLVHQLRDLFFHRHAVDQIGSPLLGRQRSIQICGLFGILCVETIEGKHRHKKEDE